MSRFADYASLATRVRMEQAKDIAAIRAAGFDPYYHGDPSPHFCVPADEWERIKPPPIEPNPLTAGVVGNPFGGFPVYFDRCPCDTPPATPPEPK